MAEPDDRLDAELRALGQTLVVAAPAEDLVEHVLARLPAGPDLVACAGRALGADPPPAAGRCDRRVGHRRAGADPTGSCGGDRVAADRRRAGPDGAAGHRAVADPVAAPDDG